MEQASGPGQGFAHAPPLSLSIYDYYDTFTTSIASLNISIRRADRKDKIKCTVSRDFLAEIARIIDSQMASLVKGTVSREFCLN